MESRKIFLDVAKSSPSQLCDPHKAGVIPGKFQNSRRLRGTSCLSGNPGGA
jgi:hypothetical protein